MYYWFGYKLHLVIDAIYELPIAFTLTPANEADTLQMKPLLKKAGADKEKTKPEAVISDKGYDSQDNNKFIYAECKSRFRCTSSPYGYVLKLPIAENVRRHPPVPRESLKWQRLYKMRTAVERVNSRVKDLLGLNKITIRGIAKVTVRAALSLLIMLATGVSMAKEHNYAELRSLVT